MIDKAVVSALLRYLAMEDARASVALDTESAIHTCYEGHCGPGGKYRFIPSPEDPDRGHWIKNDEAPHV